MGDVKRRAAFLWGLVVTVVFLLLSVVRLELFDALELRLYDARMALVPRPQEPSDIVLVEIDDASLEKSGRRWPWPRALLAKGLSSIDAAGPKAIGLAALLSEPGDDGSLKLIRTLIKDYQSLTPASDGKESPFLGSMRRLEQTLDHDAILADALQRTGKTVLPCMPLQLIPTTTLGTPEQNATLDSLAARLAARPIDAVFLRAPSLIMPLPGLLAAAKGLGHIGLVFDKDGKARREAPVIEFHGRFLPSYTLRLAALALNVPLERVRVDLGQSLALDERRIPLTADSNFLINFRGPTQPFKKISFAEILDKPAAPELFRDKLVLVSVSASGVGAVLATPLAKSMHAGDVAAHSVWSLTSGAVPRQPEAGAMAEPLAALVVGLFLLFILPRLKALPAGLTFIGLCAGLLGAPTWLMAERGVWIPMAYPALELVLGYLGLISLRFFVTEADKEKVEGESAETNRMLGLSFQSQGMLDMAFDKFRRVPVDAAMKDALYTLGLDFERKRHFNKAVAVYEHIEKHDPKFKDVALRKKKMIQVGETIVLGAGGTGDPLLMASGGEKPRLGRYEILQQLGKGAMGVVYLGKDPRINRTTAIKTFQFIEDADPDELKTLKARFFQEAESAGTLAHPNIVTIYDAGEEQELAYIAMEYLEGTDLRKHAKKGGLLPLRLVVKYVADVADALDYAHQKGIVHRDIKPANLMLLASGEIKVTDFGIARITASSQTQTGVVKGTPHYMSPEQISGQKVDGRSDIFSLGVVLFQLAAGEVPFTGDNVATLMHQIMNMPHPDPRSIDPSLPKALGQIIDNALHKDRDKRYQRASVMAGHMRQLGEWLDKPRAGGQA